MVKQADKNLGLVPIRGDFYAAMLRKWLVQPSFQQVTTFPHTDILRRIGNTIRYTQAISSEEKENWLNHARQANKPCPFYVIPKIHKNEKLGSRPISAQHSYMLAALSKALTNVLIPIQERTFGITKDSKSFVKRIEEFKTDKPFVFLTYDVEKCYPNIDINDAIQSLRNGISKMREHNDFWTKILQLIMYNNYVTANGKIYRQMIGTATGTQVAPPFANLYLYLKFKDILQDNAILFQERFIDDGFMLVSTKQDAERIITRLNKATSLNLTYEIDDNKAIFLDLVVYKGSRFKRDGRLDLKVYFKPTNRLLYLPMISNHPKSMKMGIVIGEAIRTLRNSSDKAEWIRALRFIFKGLMARGYPPLLIKKAWKKVRWEERDFYVTCLTTKTAPDGLLVQTRFNSETKKIWNQLLAENPIEKVLMQRNYKWTKKQMAILKKWPPKILWSDFRKVGQQVISAQDSWTYGSSRRRRAPSSEHQPKAKRLKGPIAS